MFEDFIAFISTVGFPIALAVFLLIRNDNTIRQMSRTLQQHNIATKEQTKALNQIMRLKS